jgi:hypothetical protein
MKFLVAIILTALLAFISGLFLPWWGIAIAALLVAIIINQSAGKAFLAGFLGVMLLWQGLAWWINMNNQGVLAKKIAMVLPLGGNTVYLIIATGIVGGLVAGFAAMSGSFLRLSKG